MQLIVLMQNTFYQVCKKKVEAVAKYRFKTLANRVWKGSSLLLSKFFMYQGPRKSEIWCQLTDSHHFVPRKAHSMEDQTEKIPNSTEYTHKR